MFEVTDIRVGNYLYHAEWGTIERVQAIVCDKNGDPADSELVLENRYENPLPFMFDDLSPISILPDIVERLGFSRGVHVLNDGSEVKGWKSVKNDRFFLMRDLVTWHFEDISTEVPRHINKELTFVHELQNIYFALTGEELTLRA